MYEVHEMNSKFDHFFIWNNYHNIASRIAKINQSMDVHWAWVGPTSSNADGSFIVSKNQQATQASKPTTCDIGMNMVTEEENYLF